MLKKHVLSLFGGLFASASFAGTMGVMPPPPMPQIEVHPWSVTASLGYTAYEYGANGSGQTPIGRFALGKALCDVGQASLGWELGVQNGNTMKLYINQVYWNALDGLPVNATITPLLDLLATLRVSLSSNTPVFLDLKGGLAYRRMYVDRPRINNKFQFAGEFQGGIGVPIADSSTLSVLYQGIYGGALGYTMDTTTKTANIKNIPVQNGILISLNIIL